MRLYKDLPDAIGNTPLIRLRRASEETGCEIYGKAEFINPGQSVKDRAALSIIQHAVKSGELRPGGVIVEGTAGNTGIGLALVGAAMGFRTVIVIPETQSQEKKDMIRLAGAELVEVPAKPYRNPNNFVRYSGRLAAALAKSEPNGAIWANQFDNVANRQAHIDTTGPEIWEQTGGKVDGFICAVGSGGTLAGTAEALRSRNPDVKIGLADPMGAALYNYYANGELKAEGSSITEGIGQGRITANLEGLKVDMPYQIPDDEAIPLAFRLLTEEGLCVGGSSGVNVAGAIRMAKEMGPGHTIVTILCDFGTRYQSQLYNAKFLESKNLPLPNSWHENRLTCRRFSKRSMKAELQHLRRGGIFCLVALFLVLALFTGRAPAAELPADFLSSVQKMEESGANKIWTRWDLEASRAEVMVSSGVGTADTFAAARADLDDQKIQAKTISDAAAAEISRLTKEQNALGPVPEDGIEEPIEVKKLRGDLSQRISGARALQSRADRVIARADGLLPGLAAVAQRRFLERLTTPTASPANPANWFASADGLRDALHLQG